MEYEILLQELIDKISAEIKVFTDKAYKICEENSPEMNSFPSDLYFKCRIVNTLRFILQKGDETILPAENITVLLELDDAAGYLTDHKDYNYESHDMLQRYIVKASDKLLPASRFKIERNGRIYCLTDREIHDAWSFVEEKRRNSLVEDVIFQIEKPCRGKYDLSDAAIRNIAEVIAEDVQEGTVDYEWAVSDSAFGGLSDYAADFMEKGDTNE